MKVYSDKKDWKKEIKAQTGMFWSSACAKGLGGYWTPEDELEDTEPEAIEARKIGLDPETDNVYVIYTERF